MLDVYSKLGSTLDSRVMDLDVDGSLIDEVGRGDGEFTGEGAVWRCAPFLAML